MTPDQLQILKQKLANEFVPELPPLLDLTAPAAHRADKNVARAFNGYAIQKIAGLDTATAAKSVVDGLLSTPLDAWREKVRAEAMTDMVAVDKGPLAFFRNATTARPFIIKLRDAGI
jgi:hypothetical protein